MSSFYILTFESIHKVMKAEELLKAASVSFDIIPTPKEYSSDCGMSVRFSKESAHLVTIKEILSSHNIYHKYF